MKNTWTKSIFLAGCGVLLSSAALAFQGANRVIDWALMLDLSEAQEQRINSIEADYQKRFEALNEKSVPGWGEAVDDADLLRQRQEKRNLSAAMRKDMDSVLNDEQRKKAAEIVRRFHEKMTRGLVQRMTVKLVLTDAQKKALSDGVVRISRDYGWPLDHQQNETARVRLETLLTETLTAQQLQQVKDERARLMSRWPKPRDFDGFDERPPPVRFDDDNDQERQPPSRDYGCEPGMDDRAPPNEPENGPGSRH